MYKTTDSFPKRKAAWASLNDFSIGSIPIGIYFQHPKFDCYFVIFNLLRRDESGIF
jgi:hypothetical protein